MNDWNKVIRGWESLDKLLAHRTCVRLGPSGHGDVHDEITEELRGETCVKIAEAYHAGDARDPAEVAKHCLQVVFKNHKKRMNRERRFNVGSAPLELDGEHIAVQPTTGETIEDRMAEDELADKAAAEAKAQLDGLVESAQADASAAMKKAIPVWVMSGSQPAVEIARELDEPFNTVRVWLHRASRHMLEVAANRTYNDLAPSTSDNDPVFDRAIQLSSEALAAKQAGADALYHAKIEATQLELERLKPDYGGTASWRRKQARWYGLAGFPVEELQMYRLSLEVATTALDRAYAKSDIASCLDDMEDTDRMDVFKLFKQAADELQDSFTLAANTARAAERAGHRSIAKLYLDNAYNALPKKKKLKSPPLDKRTLGQLSAIRGMLASDECAGLRAEKEYKKLMAKLDELLAPPPSSGGQNLGPVLLMILALTAALHLNDATVAGGVKVDVSVAGGVKVDDTVSVAGGVKVDDTVSVAGGVKVDKV